MVFQTMYVYRQLLVSAMLVQSVTPLETISCAANVIKNISDLRVVVQSVQAQVHGML